MSDSPHPHDHQPQSPDSATPREPADAATELPPVQPPSAGFIVQLFLVPAVIVAAIVGIWLLFGQLAAADQDWRRLVVDLKSENTHRRDRAAVALAQMLAADQVLGERGQQLSREPAIAKALAGLFEERLARKTARDEEQRLQELSILARTLGLLDVHQTSVPALQQALDRDVDREVRKDALASIAVVTNRAAERGGGLLDSPEVDQITELPGLVEDVVAATRDADPLVRHAATFTLGLLPTDASRQRLSVLLEHGDQVTSVNAAIGLARWNSTVGLPVFQTALRDLARPVDTADVQGDTPAEKRQAVEEENFRRHLILKNALHAVTLLAPELSHGQRDELRPPIQSLADDHPQPRIQTDARKTLNALDHTP